MSTEIITYQSSSKIFPGLTGLKCCNPQQNGCVCGDEEIVIRNYSSGHTTEPMTPEQRQWCIDQITWADELLEKDRGELEALTDQQLAYRTLRAWINYANSIS